jgi:hypothetical protein
MGGIFGSALFTIAAIDAWTNTTEDSGLFLRRDMLPVSVKISSTMKLSYDRVVRDTENQGPPQFFLGSESVDISAKSNAAWDDISWDMNYQISTFDMSIERSEWNSRGWIFQERLMSARIVYFTKEQIFWECADRTQTQIPVRNASRELAASSASEKGRRPALFSYQVAYSSRRRVLECLARASEVQSLVAAGGTLQSVSPDKDIGQMVCHLRSYHVSFPGLRNCIARRNLGCRSRGRAIMASKRRSTQTPR